MTIDIRILDQQINYPEAMGLMDSLHRKRVLSEVPNTILILEHPPTITRGRRAQGRDDALFVEQMQKHGIDVYDADRGGELTYHGPGQIVIYFIIRIKQPLIGAADMVTCIEDITKDIISEMYGFRPCTSAEYPGLWYRERKLMSIGLRVERGVTRHGISLNVTNDLGIYNYFEPCGMSGSVMTNISKILNRAIKCDEERELKGSLAKAWQRAFVEHAGIKKIVQSD